MKRTNSKSTERKIQSQRDASSPAKKNRNQSLSQGDNIIEDLDDVLRDINLKKPTTSYTHYLTEMMVTHKLKNLIEASQTYSKKWSKMSDSAKEKYQDMFEKDRETYKKHLEFVKRNLLQIPLKQGASAFRIFQEENVKNAIDNNEDVKQAKKNSRSEWKDLTLEQRKEFEEKRKVHEEFYEELKKSKSATNGFALFYRDQRVKSAKKQETLNRTEAEEMWKAQKSSVKDKYADYALEVNEEREKQRNLYEIVHGVRPKRPLGAYKFFLMEAAKQGKLGKNPILEGPAAWKRLSDDEKDRYQRIAHKQKLCYMVQKMEFDHQEKKNSPNSRPLSAFNCFVSDMKDKTSTEDLGGASFFEFCHKKWNKLEASSRKKFTQRADELKEEFYKKKEELKSKIDKAPKRPGNSYTIFLQQKFEEIKKGNAKLTGPEIFKMVAESWGKTTEKEKKEYAKLAEKASDLYTTQLKEFNETGFYEKGPGKKKPGRSMSTTNSSSKSTKKSKIPAARGKSRA